MTRSISLALIAGYLAAASSPALAADGERPVPGKRRPFPEVPEPNVFRPEYPFAIADRFAGKVDIWQIWNEPNGGYWQGKPEEYARCLALAGKAIHEANPKARVLGLNMAFCDVL